MIDKLVAYPLLIKNTTERPPFAAHMRQGAFIPTHKRPSLMPKQESTFERLREIFFEMFPKLDPEYKKLLKRHKL